MATLLQAPTEVQGGHHIEAAVLLRLLVPLLCCGAAGSYLVDHPKMAQALREDLLDSVTACPPNYVATSNVGCAMHLRAGLKLRGLGHIEVLHPLVLLERHCVRL